MLTDEQRERNLADAEAGARAVTQLSVRNAREEDRAAIIEAGPDRVDRAIAYAKWRMAAYESGDCAHPY